MHGRVLDLERHDHDLIRSERQRPDDAVGVVARLDGAGHDPVDADAVAAHDHVDLVPLLVEVGRPHRLGILGAELEDVADLEAGLDLERGPAARAGIAGLGVSQVEDAFEREIAARDDPVQVDVDCVAADDDRRHRGDGRSITSGILIPTGPRKPIGAPVAFSIVAASAGASTVAPTTRRNLASLSSWSPRKSAATGLPSAR